MIAILIIYWRSAIQIDSLYFSIVFRHVEAQLELEDLEVWEDSQ